jgi:hypothetical protein
MPALPIYAKGIQNFAASVANGFLNFTYEVVDNYNPNTLTGDSTTLYSYYLPAAAVALTVVTNLSPVQTELFELRYENIQLSFAAGEYYNITNGQILDVGGVYNLILGALGL